MAPDQGQPRPDWFAIGVGLAIIVGFALCLAVVGLLDGGPW
jgi:hypothetical protein